MTSWPTIFLLAALGCLCALTGCAGASAPATAQDTTKFTVENTERFAALDPATEAEVSCTGLQERTLGDGRLEVVANVKDRGEQPVRVQIQCTFLDGLGAPVASEVPWQVLSIAANATEVVRFTAPSPSPQRYAIRVRASQ